MCSCADCAAAAFQASFAEQMFHHLVKQPVRAFGPKQLAELRQSFAANGFNMRKLAAEIAVVAALPPKPLASNR